MKKMLQLNLSKLLLLLMVLAGVSSWGQTIFTEDFATASGGNNTTTGGSSSLWSAPSSKFSSSSQVYQAGGAVRLGSGSNTGQLTTVPLNLSQGGGNITVTFDVKGWTTVEGSIKVTVTGLASQTVSYTSIITGGFENKSVSFTGAGTNAAVKIETTSRRAFIDNMVVKVTAQSTPVVTTNTATGIAPTDAILNGSVTTNGVAVASKYFEYGTSTSYGTTIASQAESGTTTVAFNAVTGILNPNTLYHYRAGITYGTNNTVVTGNDVTFTTNAKVPGTIAIGGATGTTLNIYFDDVAQNGNNSTTVYSVNETSTGLFVQADGTLGATEVFQTAAQWGTKTVTGLQYSTTYTFKSRARNTAGVVTAYGNTAQGVTLANTQPTLTSDVPAPFGAVCINTTSGPQDFVIDGVNLTSATVIVGPLAGYTFSLSANGTYTETLTLTPVAGSLATEVFVKFTPVAVQSYNGNIPVSGGGAPAINITVSGSGINTPASVTTTAATNVMALSATLGGTIGNNGCIATTERGVVYSTMENPVIGGQAVIQLPEGSGAGTFTVNIAGLLPQTTYNVRAYAISNGTPLYGSNIAFTTPAYTQPAPVALPATDILNTSFTANWNLAAGADAENGYRLDVSTSPTFSTPGTASTTITETFENIPLSGSAASNYNTRSWTGVNGLAWSATGARIDQTLNEEGGESEDAITLRTKAAIAEPVTGQITSGTITGGLSRIEFDLTGAFSTDNGTVSVEALTGSYFTNVVTIGTASFNFESISTYDSGIINIAGDYRIRLTSITNDARVTIDNLSYSSLPTSVPSFVPGYENVVVSGTSQAVTGLVQNTTYYYRVRAVNTQYGSTVVSGNSNVIEVKTADPFIWTNGGWSKPGTPGVGDEVYITSDFTTSVHNAGNPTTTQNELTAKSIRVTGGTLRVSPLTTVTIVDGLTVLSPGAVVVESDGSLRQTNPLAVNTGNVRVLRDNGSLYRLDYSLWSSPVGGQNLLGFSPLTALNRFYKYDTAQNLYISNTHDTTFNPATDSFETGKGYLIRMPNSNPAPGYNQGTAPVTFSGDFTGTLTNGTIAVSLSTENLGYNAIGNPYASPVDADAFLTQNAEGASPVIGGTLYFWRKRNAVEGDAYATYTKMGGVAGSGTSGESGNGELVTATPTGVILPGQGFIVKALQGGSQNLFANTQRLAAIASNFFRSSNATEKHRMWFTLTSPQGVTYNSLIGYMQGATNEVDNAIDGERFNTANDGFYSVINNNQYAVQGRALPFTVQDEVVMGYRANNPGTYSITLDKADGLFLQGQPVYLKDRVTGTQHNIKEGAYSFTTEAGTFNDRFVVVYTDAPAMGTKDNTISANSVVVYKQGAGLVVSTGTMIMDSVRVYDIQGRAIYTKNNINAATLTIGSLPSQQQVLIVQVSTPKGTVSKKVVF